MGQWFSLDTPVSSTNKTYPHDIAEILLKVALNTKILNLFRLLIHSFDLCPCQGILDTAWCNKVCQ